MTIGDEKVVAWLDEYGWAWTTREEAAKWRKNAEPSPCIPQSAYAELAAELAEWKAQVNKLRYEVHTALTEQLAAESQLAKLRGKCEGLASDVQLLAADCNKSAITLGMEGLRGTCIEARNRLLILRDKLRALAAADGATTGKTK